MLVFTTIGSDLLLNVSPKHPTTEGKRPFRAWLTLYGVLALGTVPLPRLLTRRYGLTAGRRSGYALLAAHLCHLVFLRITLRRSRRVGVLPMPDVADALTLSRGTVAATLIAVHGSGVRDRSGLAGRYAWFALLWGETISDWLDGPLARRRGSTRLGSSLDKEADSWLTLWAALSGIAWGDLPPWCSLAPTLRYALPLLARGHSTIVPPPAWQARWAKRIGIAQMSLVTIALYPGSRHRSRGLIRRVSSLVAFASLVSWFIQAVDLAYRKS